jgi:tetratricopeptide (TPR) repeat protein
MAKDLTKEDIRRNPLAEWVATALEAIRARKKLAAGVLIAILVIGAGVGLYAWHRREQERDAQGLLVKAYSAMWSGAPGTQRNPDEAKKVYVEIASKYSGTVAAEEALIRLGNMQSDGSKYDEAIGTYGNYLTTYPRGRFRVMAGVGKAYAEEAKGDLAAAEKTLTQVVEVAKDDPLAGEAYSSLAHVYEAMKKPEDALRVYNQIAERFPQTHWAQSALQRMNALKSK